MNVLSIKTKDFNMINIYLILSRIIIKILNFLTLVNIIILFIKLKIYSRILLSKELKIYSEISLKIINNLFKSNLILFILIVIYIMMILNKMIFKWTMILLILIFLIKDSKLINPKPISEDMDQQELQSPKAQLLGKYIFINIFINISFIHSYWYIYHIYI